jgi:lambda family phage portal protein
MERNDGVVSRALTIATNNTIDAGFTLDMDTGSKSLDDAIEKKWQEWAQSPEACDAAGELTFPDMEKLACYQMLMDGDIIFTGTEDGKLQSFEADQCRTPTYSKEKKRIALGVRLTPDRHREAYYLLPRSIDPMSPVKLDQFLVAPTRGQIGDFEVRQVFHVYNPRRVSQTRGIGVFVSVVNESGMREDLEIATLVQAQAVSCVTLLKQYLQGGGQLPPIPTPQTSGTGGGVGSPTYNSSRELLERQLKPGMELHATPGMKWELATPNVPAPQYDGYHKSLLANLGGAAGLPLVLLMMDASETNFSGWRGALEEAKKGFRSNQRCFDARFHRPVTIWRLANWFASGEIVVPKSAKDPFRHRWTAPKWPYIEPEKDRKARRLAEKFGQTSPRRAAAECGENYWDVLKERIADNKDKIVAAKTAAQEINEQFDDGNPVTWRDVLDPEEPAGKAGGLNPDPAAEEDDESAGDKTKPTKKQGAKA